MALGKTIDFDEGQVVGIWPAAQAAQEAVETLRKVSRPVPVCGEPVDTGIEGVVGVCIRQIGHNGAHREKK